MTKVVFKRTGVDPAELFAHAASTINPFLQQAFEETTDATVKVSRKLAPVYNPAKYPSWNRMPHAKGKHGLLKASIKRKPVRVTTRTFKTSIYSRKRYSSYIERGFTHKIARKYVRGRFYIKVPIKVVHERMLFRRTNIAFKKAYTYKR